MLAGTRSAFQWIIARPANRLPSEKHVLLDKASGVACLGVNCALDDPGQCRVDPVSLLCTGSGTDGCLPQPEAKAMRTPYAKLKNASGKSVYPGLIQAPKHPGVGRSGRAKTAASVLARQRAVGSFTDTIGMYHGPTAALTQSCFHRRSPAGSSHRDSLSHRSLLCHPSFFQRIPTARVCLGRPSML